MYQLEFTINEQQIEGDFQKPLNIASDTIQFVDCSFVFLDENWDELDYIQAIFESTGHYKHKNGQILDVNGHCQIPWENLADEGMIRVNLAGGIYKRDMNGAIIIEHGKPAIETRITTFKIDCVNVKQKVNADALISKTPTPTVFEQMIGRIENEMYNSIVEIYDIGAEYVVGDYAMHDGLLYKCIEDTMGEWDATAWTLTKITDEFSAKVDKIEGKGLSTNDFTDEYVAQVEDNTTSRHTHENKEFLDELDEDSKFDPREHTHEVGDIVDFPTEVSAFDNNVGYLSEVLYEDVVSALGYTPYDATNPEGYVTDVDIQSQIDDAVEAEAELRATADNEIYGRFQETTDTINGVITQHQTDITSLRRSIDTVWNNLQNEISERKSSVSQVSNAISTEINSRRAADDLLQPLSRKVTVITDGVNDIQYPSAKAVKDYVDALETRISELEGKLEELLNELS